MPIPVSDGSRTLVRAIPCLLSSSSFFVSSFLLKIFSIPDPNRNSHDRLYYRRGGHHRRHCRHSKRNRNIFDDKKGRMVIAV